MGWNGESKAHTLNSIDSENWNKIYAGDSTRGDNGGFYFASPSYYTDSCFIGVTAPYLTTFQWGWSARSCACLRPVVCLKNGVSLKKENNGTFTLLKP